MATQKINQERDIALAFLRMGHPWLAFAVVMLKSAPRILTALGAVVGLYLAGPSAASILVNAIAPSAKLGTSLIR